MIRRRAGGSVGVAMTIQAFAPTVGGGEIQLERLLPLLGQRGVHARVFTRAVAGTPSRDVIAGTDVYRTRVPGESPIASAVYVIESFIEIVRTSKRTDVVHAHGALSPATIALAARAMGKPCVVTILGAGPPGDLSRLRRKPAGRLRLTLLAKCAQFVALSTEVANELEAAGVPASRITVIANGVDFTAFAPIGVDERAALRAELGLDRHGCYAVFVGRLHPVKAVDTLLQALARSPGIELLVVGDGQERDALQRLARDLRVDERARFVGATDRVAQYLKASDAFFLPSLGEGMSNALLEAMSCGLPCVASSAVGGVDELFGGTRGLTATAGDIDAWTDAMTRLTADPALRNTLGTEAARYVRAHYAIERTADALVALYGELAGS